MESPAVTRYIPRKSKKRVFPGSSSSNEPDVIEISPPRSNRDSKSKPRVKSNEPVFHEIIDVDMDEDNFDVTLTATKAELNKKRKDNFCISLGPSTAALPGSVDKVHFSEKTQPNTKGKDAIGLISSAPSVAVQPDSLDGNHNSNKSFAPGLSNLFDLGGSLQMKNIMVQSADAAHAWKNTSSIVELPPLLPSYGPATSADHFLLWHSYSDPSLLLQTHATNVSSDLFSAPEAADIFPSEADRDSGKRQKRSNVAGSSSGMARPDIDDVLKKYENFKKFDTVEDYSDHYYSRQSSETKQPPKNWTKKIQDEWRILEKDLPDTIFVRAYESRMDLLRAVIIGAEGTPYHDGLFFFDVCFPSSYPASPPLVHYHSGGLRINPNLYNCGKVCLSLLNTWTGHQKERWTPGVSTMLQVLVSIQGLILNSKPYFNEPGYAHSSGSVHGEMASLQYNEDTLILSLKTMVYTMKKPPKNFEDLVMGHFQSRVRDILMACKAYTEGVQVGCLVRGGVQDVDEGDKSCSPKFKADVASYIKTIVAALKKIGAKGAEEFLCLGQKKTPSRAHSYHP